MGVKIVGILTREGGLINQAGFSHEEICKLGYHTPGKPINYRGAFAVRNCKSEDLGSGVRNIYSCQLWYGQSVCILHGARSIDGGSRDDAALSKSYRKMSELRQQMFDLSLSAQKQIDAVLTKEQRDKMKRG